MEKWIKWKHSEQVARGLNDIAHGRIPEGKFKPLWDKEAITPLGSLPSKPSFSDKLKIKNHHDEVNRRKAENARIIAERNEWWRDGNNEYFTMITDSMIVSAPSMREMLQERYRIDDGIYDGYGAMETYIKEWMRVMAARNPCHSHYEAGLELITKQRLPEGVSADDFLSRVRRFTIDINPYLRAPYEGEKLGEYILDTIMPQKYLETSERIKESLRKEGLLADIEVVENTCREAVQKRAPITGRY